MLASSSFKENPLRRIFIRVVSFFGSFSERADVSLVLNAHNLKCSQWNGKHFLIDLHLR